MTPIIGKCALDHARRLTRPGSSYLKMRSLSFRLTTPLTVRDLEARNSLASPVRTPRTMRRRARDINYGISSHRKPRG